MYVHIGPYGKSDKRKVKIKIHKYDTWNMDHTLALLIVPMLKQLKKTKHGVPGDFVFGESDEDYKKAEEAWDLVLDKMIWSFNTILREFDFEEDFWKDGKYNKDAYYAYQEHINEGLQLFGKYYQALWD